MKKSSQLKIYKGEINLIEYTLRKPYRTCTARNYTDLKSYFKNEADFSINKIHSIKNAWNKIENDLISSRVWLLFARNDENENWTCIQVAHSKNDVKTEVKDALTYLKSISFNDLNNVKFENSAFYEEVCPKHTNIEYRKLLYSKIGNDYKHFKICLLDVDKYLNLEQCNQESDTKKIVEICKNQYAEAKIAYELLAVYWRHVSSGIDGQTISYIVNHPHEFNSKNCSIKI